jgi:hypothetical protein
MSKLRFRLVTSLVGFCLVCSITLAQTAPTPAPAGGTTASATKSSSKTPTTGPATDAQIAAAKANHQVWVNLDSGKYHKGGRWYGKTKNGKFMSEADAKAAGYKAAGRD